MVDGGVALLHPTCPVTVTIGDGDWGGLLGICWKGRVEGCVCGFSVFLWGQSRSLCDLWEWLLCLGKP